MIRPVVGCMAGMALLIPMAAQDRADRALIEAEQAREAGVPALSGGGERAMSVPRCWRPAPSAVSKIASYRDVLIPLLDSPDPQVRRAAAGALAQMRVPFAWAGVLKAERDGSVRAAIFEAIGRAKPAAEDAESLLAGGLKDADPQARAGAARGLESLFRLNSKPPRKPAAATIAALHQTFAANREEEIRELILLTMRAAGDRDPATLASALADPSAQVRRLAVPCTGTLGARLRRRSCGTKPCAPRLHVTVQRPR